MELTQLFLIPGISILDLVFGIAQISPDTLDPIVLRIASGIISWIAWVSILKATWIITSSILGLNRPKGRM